MTSHVIH